MEATQLNILAFSALAELTRLKIVELLRDGPLTVGEVATELKIRQPQASKHLKVLSDCKILQLRAEANRRIYSVDDETFKNLSEWAQTFIRVMDERFDKLDNYLIKIQKQKKSIKEKKNDK